MIKIQKTISFPETYPLKRIGPLEELLFFDIETTGFSGDSSNVYLIGCVYYENQTWNLIQWFADQPKAEEEALHEFFRFLSHYRILIHFNGDGFDIPYLMKRCRCFGLSYDFGQIISVDIYKKIKPFKKLLGLDSMKQKSIEQFLGIHRQDHFSGGQLIDVYHEYLITRDNCLYDLLLLHNEDDLKGMPAILPVLNYPDFLNQPMTLKDFRTLSETDLFGASQQFLELTFEGTGPDLVSVPVEAGYEVHPVSCRMENSCLELTIELFRGSLKHFYPNYKDYYYLIYEDTAIHKSVGEFVDKSARRQATARTCYTKQQGCFLPQFDSLWNPVFHKERRDKISYVEFSEERLANDDCIQAYRIQLLNHLGLESRSCTASCNGTASSRRHP